MFLFSSSHSHKYWAATILSLANVHDIAVTINSTDTEIGRTSQHCFCGSVFVSTMVLLWERVSPFASRGREMSPKPNIWIAFRWRFLFIVFCVV